MTRSARLTIGLVALVLLAALAAVAIAWPRAPALVAWDELDTRWGTYLSEREWGTPREAIGDNPWGMDYLRAIRTPYRHGEDGIAGLVDREGTFHIGWAVWDERQVRVAERFFGWGNPSGENGEEIVDRRTFGINTPTSSVADAVFVYPNSNPQFRIVLSQARVDDVSGVLVATADRDVAAEEGASPAPAEELPLHVVLKGWFHEPDFSVEPIDGGILLRGPSTSVAIVSAEATDRLITAEKRDLDEQLRDGGLSEGVGHIGALALRLAVGDGPETVAFAWAEDADPETAAGRARDLVRTAGPVLAERRAEAATVFSGEVDPEHEPVYRQALMSLLWSQSLYRWDGASEWIPDWEGRVAADDVLIMPDKW